MVWGSFDCFFRMEIWLLNCMKKLRNSDVVRYIVDVINIIYILYIEWEIFIGVLVICCKYKKYRVIIIMSFLIWDMKSFMYLWVIKISGNFVYWWKVLYKCYEGKVL